MDSTGQNDINKPIKHQASQLPSIPSSPSSLLSSSSSSPTSLLSSSSSSLLPPTKSSSDIFIVDSKLVHVDGNHQFRLKLFMFDKWRIDFLWIYVISCVIGMILVLNIDCMDKMIQNGQFRDNPNPVIDRIEMSLLEKDIHVSRTFIEKLTKTNQFHVKSSSHHQHISSMNSYLGDHKSNQHPIIHSNRFSILIVMGTRPEIIKLFPVILELQQWKAKELLIHVEIFICFSGQHSMEMVKPLQDFFNISMDCDMKLSDQGQNGYGMGIHDTTEIPRQNDFQLNNLLSQGTEKMSALIDFIRPDMVMVQGDTSTAFLAALSCFYNHVPVAHVEAGLRTYDLHSPFPEEFHRRVISLATTLHFCPSQKSKMYLLNESLLGSEKDHHRHIHVVGNTVIDTLRWMGYLQSDESDNDTSNHINDAYTNSSEINDNQSVASMRDKKIPFDPLTPSMCDSDFVVQSRRYSDHEDNENPACNHQYFRILFTAHRREIYAGHQDGDEEIQTIGNDPSKGSKTGIHAILQTLQQLSEKYQCIQIVMPIHPNPHIRSIILSSICPMKEYDFDCHHHHHQQQHHHHVDCNFNNNTGIIILKPLPYPQFINLLNQMDVVVTDSGGIQEEVTALGIPTLVIRNKTERMEAIHENSTNKLIGMDAELLQREVELLYHHAVSKQEKFRRKRSYPYGKGDASRKIVEALRNWWLEKQS